MAVNKNDIIRAGLESQYDRWGDAHQFWTGLVAWNWSWVIVLGALAWLGFNTVTSARSKAAKEKLAGIERELEKFLADEEKSLLDKSPTQWPRTLLIRKGAVEVVLDNGWSLFSSRVPASGDALEAIDYQIRTKDDEAIARVLVSGFGNQYVWPYAEDANVLEDGENTIEISEAIARTNIRKHIREADPTSIIDVVGVGLESSHGGDDDPRRLRSDLRGQSLASATRNWLEEISLNPRISYHTLGLGKHVDCVSVRGSSAERAQRAVLIAVVTRLRTEIVQIKVEQALSVVLADAASLPIDLSKYEGYPVLRERLSGPLIFDGGDHGSPWVPPKIFENEESAPETCD